jgi:phospholipid/cholesterol/gamma-HCH transport system substrate-binding protein
MTKRTRQMLRTHMGHIAALFGMIVLSAAVSLYVAVHERFRFPWQQETRIYAEFENAQSVTPGQGQTVNVAGVQVGEIGGVRLEHGRAVVQMNLTSDDLGPVYRSAHLQLRPKTGLNDMAIEMDPGRPDPSLPDRGRLHDGDRLPIQNTRPNVNPDQVLAALDTDTRRYLEAFVNAGGAGLAGRDADLQAAVERLPGALHATTTALSATRGLALDARPALTQLRPVARELAPALVKARPLLREATPVVRDRLRPLVRAATPLLALLRPSVERIESVTPPLVDVAHVANRAVNELAYNPPGSEEGYLYWLAWYIHNGNSVLSVEDAHGVAWRGLVMFGCSTLGDILASNPALAPLAGLPICPPPPPKKGAAAPLARPKPGTAAEIARSARAPGEPRKKATAPPKRGPR